MCSFLGKIVTRCWPVVLAAWCVLLLVIWLAAPAWDSVTRSGEVAFLPADAPSQRADQLFRASFPDVYSGSTIVVALWREQGELSPQDRQFIIEVLSQHLGKLVVLKDGQPPFITRILNLADEGGRVLLTSPDHKATLVLMDLRTPFLDPENPVIVGEVEGIVRSLRSEGQVPPGLQIAVTGSATAGRDLERAAMHSERTIETWAIVAVVVLLLLLYRAPLVALIPLVTVFLAVRISLGVLAWVAGAGWITLDRDSAVFITVLAYGTGVDYCLFLIARFREERDRGLRPAPAVVGALGRVGGAICASSLTVIFGMALLYFTRFGKSHQAGVTIPFALAVVLAAVLTFTPALLRLVGRWAFWPQLRGATDTEGSITGFLRRLPGRTFLSSVWEKVGPVLLRRPGMIWLGSVLVCLPLVMVGGLHVHENNFNPISELPADMPSVVGLRELQRHFPAGTLSPITVLLESDQIDFKQQHIVDLVGQWTNALVNQKDELDLQDIRSVSKPLGITPPAKKAISKIPLPAILVQDEVRRRAIRAYVSRIGAWAGHVTRMDLTLKADPLSQEALRNLNRIRETLLANLPPELAGSRLHICGPTANLHDLAVMKETDLRLVQLVVPVTIFGLLLFLIRRVVISAYLIGSVLFTYLFALGATFVVFWALDPAGFAGIDWKVPLYVFTILIAVGEDYNLFLIARIREEQRRYGPLKGITPAVGHTGRVISACGFIMAGTFATLLSGSLVAMKQLGFALALGVLFDTLLVRPILVPAFLIMLENGLVGRLGRELALEHDERKGETPVDQLDVVGDRAAPLGTPRRP